MSGNRYGRARKDVLFEGSRVVSPTTKAAARSFFVMAIFVALLCHHQGVWALESGPLVLSPEREVYEVLGHLDILEDPSGELTPAQIFQPPVADRFRPAAVGDLNAGLTDSVFWYRFRVVQSERPEYPIDWLVYAGPHCAAQVWYLPDGAGGTEGMVRVPGVSPDNTFRLPADLSQPVTVYLRARSAVDLHVPLQVRTYRSVYRHTVGLNLLLGMHYGILIAMVLVNLIVYAALRDRVYLWYTAYIVSVGLFFFWANGSFRRVWADIDSQLETKIVYVLLWLMAMFGVQFTRAFLLTKSRAPRTDKVLAGVGLFSGLAALSFPFANLEAMTLVAAAFGYAVPVIIIGCGVIRWAQGFVPARFFLLAWSLFLIGAMVHVLLFTGVVPYSVPAYYAWQAGAVLETLLLAVALTYRIRALNLRREAAERAREDAEELNALQSLMLNNSLIGIAYVRDFRFQWVNERLAEMVGSTPEQLHDMPLRALVINSPAYERSVEAVRNAFERGETVDMETMFRRADGTVFWGRCLGKALDAPVTDQGSIWILEDVTEAKRASQALRDSEERLRNVIASSPFGILMCEEDNGGRLVLIGSNPAATRIMQVDFEARTGDTLESIFPDLREMEMLGHLRAAAIEGTPWHSEEVAYEEGEVRLALEVHAFQVSPGRVVISFQDILERKRAEELVKRESSLFAGGPVVVFELLHDEAQLARYVSPNVRQMGYQPEDFTGGGPVSFMDLVHPEDAGAMQNAVSGLAASTATGIELEYRFRVSGGAYRWMSDFVTLLYAENGSVESSLHYLADISSRKTAETALERSEKQFRGLVETMPHGVVEIDRDGRILFANPAQERLFGYGRDELLGMYYADLFVSEQDRREAAETRRAVLAAEAGLETFEVLCATKAGQHLWVQIDYNFRRNASGGITGFIGVLTDITERKRAEEELRASEAKFAKLFRTAPDAITLADMDGVFLDVNDGCLQILGYTRDELIGRPALELGLWRSLEDREIFMDKFRREGAVRNWEARFRLKSGAELTGLISADIIEIHGEPCIMSIVRDITQRKNAEEERERLIDELRAAARQIHALHGLLPICPHCKKIRDVEGLWQKAETYLSEHSNAEFTHAVCPDCAEQLYVRRGRDNASDTGGFDTAS